MAAATVPQRYGKLGFVYSRRDQARIHAQIASTQVAGSLIGRSASRKLSCSPLQAHAYSKASREEAKALPVHQVEEEAVDSYLQTLHNMAAPVILGLQVLSGSMDLATSALGPAADALLLSLDDIQTIHTTTATNVVKTTLPLLLAASGSLSPAPSLALAPSSGGSPQAYAPSLNHNAQSSMIGMAEAMSRVDVDVSDEDASAAHAATSTQCTNTTMMGSRRMQHVDASSRACTDSNPTTRRSLYIAARRVVRYRRTLKLALRGISQALLDGHKAALA